MIGTLFGPHGVTAEILESTTISDFDITCASTWWPEIIWKLSICDLPHKKGAWKITSRGLQKLQPKGGWYWIIRQGPEKRSMFFRGWILKTKTKDNGVILLELLLKMEIET